MFGFGKSHIADFLICQKGCRVREHFWQLTLAYCRYAWMEYYASSSSPSTFLIYASSLLFSRFLPLSYFRL